MNYIAHLLRTGKSCSALSFCNTFALMVEFIGNIENQVSLPVWNTLVFLGSLLVGILIKLILQTILRFSKKRSDHYLFKLITKHLSTPAAFFIPLVIVNASQGMMRLTERAIFSKTIEICLI